MLLSKLEAIFSKLPIYGFQGTTLIDFPNVISSILFTGGCNLRCPYCHNRDLVHLNTNTMTKMPAAYFLSEMEKRKKIIKGINITGGEPLLFEEGILELSDFIKNDLSMKVKIDTNGTRIETLKKLIDSGNVDYVALDVKSTLNNYDSVGIQSESELESIRQSIQLLKTTDVENEYRITITPTHLPKDKIREYGELVRGGKRLFLQQFTPQNTLDPSWEAFEPYKKSDVEEIAQILSEYIPTAIRGF